MGQTIEEFFFVRKIGNGQFGCVYLCCDTKSRREVAVKRIELRNLSTDPNQRARLEKVLYEVRIMRLLPHPNLIKILGLKVYSNTNSYKFKAIDDVTVHIVMPLMSGSLNSLFAGQLGAGKRLGIELLWFARPLVHKILNGLGFLHSKGMIHRDIKLDNVFFSQSDGQVVLGDMGWARELAEEMTKKVVVIYHRAPELLTKNPVYGCAIDVWAIGCILAQIMLGDVLFRHVKLNKDFDTNRKVLLAEIAWAVSPLKPEDVAFLPEEDRIIALSGSLTPSDQGQVLSRLMGAWKDVVPPQYEPLVNNYVDLTVKCLQFNPQKRITMAEAIYHPLFFGLSIETGNSDNQWSDFNKTGWSNNSAGVQKMFWELQLEAYKIEKAKQTYGLRPTNSR